MSSCGGCWFEPQPGLGQLIAVGFPSFLRVPIAAEISHSGFHGPAWIYEVMSPRVPRVHAYLWEQALDVPPRPVSLDL